LECLESTDSAEEEQLKRQPFARANPVQNHVGRDLKENNTERQHLLTDIELVLGDTDIFEEICGEGALALSTMLIGNIYASTIYSLSVRALAIFPRSSSVLQY
jgi:hypothetical protein